MPELRIAVQPMHLESGSWVQRLTVTFDGLEHSLIIHTTRDELEARRLGMTLPAYLSSAFAEVRAEATTQQGPDTTRRPAANRYDLRAQMPQAARRGSDYSFRVSSTRI